MRRFENDSTMPEDFSLETKIGKPPVGLIYLDEGGSGSEFTFVPLGERVLDADEVVTELGGIKGTWELIN